MRTSRVFQETAKVAKISPSTTSTRRQTRSFAASLSADAANGSLKTDLAVKAKREDSSDDESSLSSVLSVETRDIEDALHSSTPQKRKRGAHTPATTVTSISNTATDRLTARKVGIKLKKVGSGKPKKVRPQPAKSIVEENGEVEIHPPDKWEEIYSAVTEMRKGVSAPVDTMGCETLAEEHASPRVCPINPSRKAKTLTIYQDKRFQTLIALMLSSQTRDTKTAVAMRRLQTELPPPGLTLENILEVDPERLKELICAVGFYNSKTRFIKATAEILRDKFNHDIPDTIEGLISLPGVGPKMGYLCLSAAWGRNEGIGVDVHVHRITNLWGWHKTKVPEATRAALESWLPKEKWHDINRLLVGFGQTICLPVRRKCGKCTLSENGLCPSAVIERKFTVKRVKKEGMAKVKNRDGDVTVEVDYDNVMVKQEEKTVADVEDS